MDLISLEAQKSYFQMNFLFQTVNIFELVTHIPNFVDIAPEAFGTDQVQLDVGVHT